MKENIKIIVRALFGLLLAVMLTLMIFFCLLCGGCTRKVYVPMENVRTEYRDADTSFLLNNIRQLLESRRVRQREVDSVFDHIKETVVLNPVGDTTVQRSERIVYRSMDRTREYESKIKEKDSVITALYARLLSESKDSIINVLPPEKKDSKWSRVKMDLGTMVTGAILLIVVSFVVRQVKRYRK